ncbi:prepilin-type N-terminal cleavage/methylation domain-containing protein [Butyrivibrio fibrisolvens DSM 3071]|uniref:Prepilin-type N-terminal cleavage/methylation domain-containing protein n=1 Tax=Butyrivibrio fibrisolvens DSM 3071 TaxID=1121131 RepID=A0A1M5X5G1_BUTFI|nr:type II secretion system protein [Butyrivibrio fibrisolvens]SHH94768.1 prepilin-type N-terminal cleavage/methylation domain-containing protein [Butyrivibrio fibrisolvens DSM 3071]
MIKFLRNYRNNAEENQEDNKGFSLVELIIVIAIMAILVAVLAPQFLQYVERSRNSTDASNATSIVAAVQTYLADPANSAEVKGFSTDTVTVDADGFSPTDGVLGKALAAAGYDEKADIKCKSTSAWTEYTIKFTYDKGSLNVEYGGTDFANYMQNGAVKTTE